ncbi:DUF2809 domain-containing protein [Aquimarina longa]|uniref:ribosomal maturation YjgA family protein n=1 Tax=Aquimarina longa TaxID=1080221 RepID=UPI00078101AA|nr:DUF2809 domain-containing protein [Aquimarina longa]
MTFRFQKKYFFLTILLFLIEVMIALFVDDQIIRPYIGDTLVVILMYCFFKSFINCKVLPLAIAVLLFSYTIEILQYYNFVQIIGLQHSRLANIIIGNSFSWADMIAYTLGFIVIIWLEKVSVFKQQNSIAEQ